MKKLKNRWIAAYRCLFEKEYFLITVDETNTLFWVNNMPTDSYIIERFETIKEYSVNATAIKNQLNEILK